MPQRSKSLPSYRRHKASQQAFVELNGRRHYLGPHGTKVSRLEYDRLVGEWLARGRVPEQREHRSGIVVAELIVSYLEFAGTYYRKHGEQSTEFRDIKLSLRPLREMYGECLCDEFGPIKLEAVRQRMIDCGLSRGVINQRIGRIKRMFKWGVSKQLLVPDLFVALSTIEGLKLGRSKARDCEPIKPVSDEIVSATLPYLPAVVADMVLLQRLAGMRPEEVCAIRPADLDRDGDVWCYTPQSHKTEHHGKRRVIAIGPAAQHILRRYLARRPDSHCFSPRDSEAKRRAERHAARVVPLCCGNRPGTNRKRIGFRNFADGYTVGNYRQAIYRGCDAAFRHPELASIKPKDLTTDQRKELKLWIKLHRWAPNRLRHARGTEVRKKFGLEAAQVVLGHSNAYVSQIYAKRDMELAVKVALATG